MMSCTLRKRALRLFAACGLPLMLASEAVAPVAGQRASIEPGGARSQLSQPGSLPRAADGHPDLEGVWLDNRATPLQRPEALQGRTALTDTEVSTLQRRADRIFADGRSDFPLPDDVFFAALADVERFEFPLATHSSAYHVARVFDNRTSLIVDPPDGRIPPLTREAQERQAARSRALQRPTGPAGLHNTLRCLTWGVPRFQAGVPYSSHLQIVQSPDSIVLHMETDVRVIPLDDRPHLPPQLRRLNGDSRGRWEGSTLVVETTNFSTQSSFMGSAENLHLVERFTRLSLDALRYEVTIDDPTTWTRPWTVEVRMQRTEDRLYEFACHEGSYELIRGILAHARTDGPR